MPAGGLARRKPPKGVRNQRADTVSHAPPHQPRGDCKASCEPSTPVPTKGRPLPTTVLSRAPSGGKGACVVFWPLDPGCRGTLGLREQNRAGKDGPMRSPLRTITSNPPHPPRRGLPNQRLQRTSGSFSVTKSPPDEGGSRRSKFNVVSCPSATSTSRRPTGPIHEVDVVPPRQATRRAYVLVRFDLRRCHGGRRPRTGRNRARAIRTGDSFAGEIGFPSVSHDRPHDKPAADDGYRPPSRSCPAPPGSL